MSAVAARTAPTSPGWVPAGTAVLAGAALRRERRRLIWWVLGVGGIAGYAAVALGSVYPTAADRQARAALIDTPVGILLSGPGYGIGDYTLGAMIANELTLSVMVGVAIMAISLVVRLTRAEEESGRAELVRAGAVDRRAPVLAALAVTGERCSRWRSCSRGSSWRPASPPSTPSPSPPGSASPGWCSAAPLR